MSKPKFDRSAVIDKDDGALADLEPVDFMRPLDRSPEPGNPTPPEQATEPTARAIPGPLPPGDPRSQDADPADGKKFLGWRVSVIRQRQLTYEAADLGVNEGEIVDRALDMYFKTKRAMNEDR